MTIPRAAPDRLTRGQLARESGVNPESIRYYERQGLLAPPPRSPAGYRHFPAAAVARVRLIKRARKLGFSIAEIRELFRRDASASDAARLAPVDARIQQLRELKSQLLGHPLPEADLPRR